MADKDFVVKNGLVTGANNATFGTAVTLASNGNVGVGNTTPADKLVVTGSITATANISAASVNASTGFYGTVQTATQGTINHNSLANYSADQHVAHSGVSISAGSGLTGGGTIAASRTISVSPGNTQLVANATGLWADQTKFDHNSLTNYVADQHVAHSTVSVSAGNGLTGGGTIAANRSLAVSPGNTQLVANATGLWVDQTKIDHNSLTNYASDQHVAHSGVSISAGNGLTGGGTIAASRSLAVLAGNTQLIANSTGVWANQAQFDHNSLTNYASDQHVAHSGVSISAGNGLTGGGTIAASRTVSVLANTGIVANATGVYVNATYIGTLSANNTTYVNGKTEGNLNVNNALTSNNTTYVNGKTEGNLNVNSASTFSSTNQNVRFNSVGVNVAASGTAGQINATGNIQTSSGVFIDNAGTLRPQILGTTVTASGATFGFSGLPSWATQITVTMNALVGNAAYPCLRLGTSGGIVSTGYVWISSNFAGSTASTAGFTLPIALSSQGLTGTYTLTKQSAGLWLCTLAGSFNATNVVLGGGSVNITNDLTQLQFGFTGSGSYVSGSVNILYS